MRIRDWNISARAKYCLLNAGYTDVDELADITEDQLLEIRNLNQKGAQEILNALAEGGFVSNEGFSDTTEDEIDKFIDDDVFEDDDEFLVDDDGEYIDEEFVFSDFIDKDTTIDELDTLKEQGTSTINNPILQRDDVSSKIDSFEDITIYDDEDITIDFCGLKFDANEKTLIISIWISNSSNEIRNFWAKNVNVNGVIYESIDNLGSLESCDSDYLNEKVLNVNGVEYEEIIPVDFSVEIDDEDDMELDNSRRVFVMCNTVTETMGSVKVRNYLSDTETESDDELVSEDDLEDDFEFENMVVFDNDDVQVEFDGIDFDNLDETINLNIWVVNDSDETKNFWIHDIQINGKKHGDDNYISLGEVEAGESDFRNYTIYDTEICDSISYNNIRKISFIVEIDDEYDNCLYDSAQVNINCNTDKEFYTAESD